MPMSMGKYDSLLDVGAGTVMALAVGYCLWTGWLPGQLEAAGGGSFVAFLLTVGVMKRVDRDNADEQLQDVEYVHPVEEDTLEAYEENEAVEVAREEVGEVDAEPPSEEATAQIASDQELELGEIAAEMQPDSRVVQLFGAGPEPVSEPSELKNRVDRHLAGASEADPLDKLLADKPQPLSDEAVDATNRLAAALDRVRRRLD